MIRFFATGAALLVITAPAEAAGIERSNQSVSILFEEGTFLEFGANFVAPNVVGLRAGVSSENMAEGYSFPHVQFRTDITEALSFAMIWDEHIGSNVSYDPTTAYPVAGSSATIEGQALTALLRYEFPSDISVYGGVRISTVQGVLQYGPSLGLFPLNGYGLTADGGTELGYVLGAAYEIPEIALRIALTYNSEIDHSFSGTSNLGPTGWDTTIPESWMLEAQTGIREDTLVFGSIRWVDWTVATIDPSDNPSPNPLLSYTNDTFTYSAGVGRRFSDNWSGAVSVLRAPQLGRNASDLGPTDGRTALGLSLTWENEQYEVTAGVQYSWFDDTETAVGRFTESSAVAAGFRIGIRF